MSIKKSKFCYFAIALMSLFPALSVAEQAQLTWEMAALTIDDDTFNRLELDVDIGPRYIKAHGAIANSTTFQTIPATGTCFLTANDGAFCNLQISLFMFSVTLNADLNGSYVVTKPDGEQVGPVALTLIDIR